MLKRKGALFDIALALVLVSAVSGQFFVNLGDKNKGTGTDVDAAASGQGSVPAAGGATDTDVQTQADPNVKLQVYHYFIFSIYFMKDFYNTLLQQYLFISSDQQSLQ